MKQKWQAGKWYKIVGLEEKSDRRIANRLLEFGFTPNQRFFVSHKSLLGRVVIVEIRGFSLSMRSEFLSCLKVQNG